MTIMKCSGYRYEYIVCIKNNLHKLNVQRFIDYLFMKKFEERIYNL